MQWSVNASSCCCMSPVMKAGKADVDSPLLTFHKCLKHKICFRIKKSCPKENETMHLLGASGSYGFMFALCVAVVCPFPIQINPSAEINSAIMVFLNANPLSFHFRNN